MSKVLLLIAQEGFQTKEYYDTKHALSAAGHTVVTASAEKGKAVSNIGEEITTDLALRDVPVEYYDGVFAIGGPGALRFLDNKDTARIMREAEARPEMPYGAICIAPRILAKAGVLRGKKATGWDEDGKLESILRDGGASYEHAGTVTDGRVVTADGPMSAEAFGKAIAKLLK